MNRKTLFYVWTGVLLVVAALNLYLAVTGNGAWYYALAVLFVALAGAFVLKAKNATTG